MAQNRPSQDKGMQLIRIKKVVTLVELSLHLNCSPRTAQRRLSDWQAIHSYNRNGRCYTLPNIPQFDDHGLWRHQGAYFSRFGDLPATFVQLVGHSPAGLVAFEAGALLGLRPSSFLWSLREHPGLRREKHQGVYVYFSSDTAKYKGQMQQRLLMRKNSRLPTDSEAVAILVEKIKEPSLSNEELSRRLIKERVFVTSDTIQNLLIRHGLAEKKTAGSH
jgi:hypothetical protein